MDRLSFNMTRYLCGQWTERTLFIYILINKEGLITEWSENVTCFTGVKLNKKQAADEQLMFLQGFLPFENCEPVVLDSVNFDTGKSADIHIIPSENELCVLLFDVTEASKMRQQLQQKSNEISLLYEQERRSMHTLRENYKQLQHQKEILEESNRIKTKFLHHVNHDLKSPLNAILGYIQLLDMYEKPLDEEQTEYVMEMEKASQYMLELVNELLDIAKIESGKITINNERLIPTTIVTDSISILRPIAEKNQIEFIVRMNHDIPLICVDPVRFRQVIINFLSNAIKYNHKDGCIIINAYVVKDSILRINIKDTGIGIDSEQLNKVFEAFERGKAENSGIEGTGIGLNVCKQLIELMQGSVGVYSYPGLGSMFWMELPLEKKHDTENFKLQNIKKYALYIDNERVGVHLMNNLINEFTDCQLLSANTLEQALEKLDKYSLSVILINCSSLKKQYLQILNKLQNYPQSKNVPIVAIFDDATEPVEIKKAMKAGFYDYLSKPIDFNFAIELFDRLKSIKLDYSHPSD